MGSKTLSDIHNDVKQLITAITFYEENEEGFQVCERFCMSNIKHHRYLSVNSNATKEAVKDVIAKFTIHGKYDVASKFEELVNTFLSSFDFDQHPQYDIQWYLLTLLFDLSTETHKSDLECLRLTRGEYTFNVTTANESEITEEIDWAEYLKEGQENFFHDYKSDSESEWSNDPEEDDTDSNKYFELPACKTADVEKAVYIPDTENVPDKLSVALAEELKSRTWLLSNIQNTWWNELDSQEYPVESKFCDAHFCKIWHASVEGSFHTPSTISEYQVCRELLWMFQVQTHMVVFQHNGVEFSIRPNTSIPSLSTAAFSSFLLPFCEYLDMISDIEQFGNDLYSKSDGIDKKPPLTYEAYHAAIKQHLIKFKSSIVQMEKNVMKQDDTNTFLSLSSLLKKPLKTIKILHEIHKAVVFDWKVCPNWECASRLLSNLYFEIQKSHSQEKTNICVSLYLSSFTVYLNIIDTWLSEGRLEDWREEFIIVRLPKPFSDNNEHYEAFSIRALDKICLMDPILQFLIKKVQHMGQSIELLVSLDRITDIWKLTERKNERRTSLVNEFYSKLDAEISKYNNHDLSEEACPSVSETDGVSIFTYDEDIEKNVIQQLSEFRNPFLLKALEDYVPVELLKKDTTDAGTHVQNTKVLFYDLFNRLENISQYILPFRKILENILAEILISRYNSASMLVKNIMTEEYKLELHLTLMRSVYMMEAGHIMNKFYQILFQEIETNPMWNNSYFLSCILEEILSQQWLDLSTRWSVTVCGIHTRQVLVAADNITLHYAVGWPINIMLNEKSFKKYNEVFRFQLKLKWALWTLNNLRFSDLEGSKLMHKRNKLEQFHIRRLESLRFWLLHAIGSIHAYLSGQVLQNLGLILEKALTHTDSLDAIISVHNEYLCKVHEHCLLTEEFEDLMATINNLIEMCDHVRKRWNHKKLMFATEELNVLENCYIKYHTYLALALHNAVQNKDANYYELMPRYDRCTENVFDENGTIVNSLNNLSRSLLTEIAHQCLPPSGLPFRIPGMIYRMSWWRNSFNSEQSLPNEININEYEQTFSYIRWYQREEHFITFNSPYFLHCEMEDIINGDTNLETNL